MSDLHEATMEAHDLRKLMIEIARRMTALWRVHSVRVSFNISQPDPAKDYKLTAFAATKELRWNDG